LRTGGYEAKKNVPWRPTVHRFPLKKNEGIQNYGASKYKKTECKKNGRGGQGGVIKKKRKCLERGGGVRNRRGEFFDERKARSQRKSQNQLRGPVPAGDWGGKNLG